MKKIPYGISSYDKIKAENYYYIDKTKYIEIIENYGSAYHFFLRPRRFGKSLFVSILDHYYDIDRKEQFETLFGDTYIGKNPTTLRNSYPILRFNFSMVRSQGTLEEIKKSFCLNVYGELYIFIMKYKDRYNLNIDFLQRLENLEDTGDMLLIFNREMRAKNISFFLIIDEYDNFANNILSEQGKQIYTQITHSGGFLRNFFTILKGLTDNREIDRLFITGVSPLVMADVTSGFNIGDNISQDIKLSAMIGINHDEVKQILEYYNSFGIFNQSINSIIDDFNVWYDGYSFNEELERIYNSISVLYYVHQYIKKNKAPAILIDENMRTDYGKFRFLLKEDNKLNGNFSVLKEIMQNNETYGTFIRSFALNELVDSEKFRSLLFYLGFVSIKEVSPINTYTFTIPNKLISSLLWEFVQKAVNEVYELKIDNDYLIHAFADMALRNVWKPALQYILDKFYQAVSIRDFVFHEEGIKTFMLAWLNMAAYYKVYSEHEFNQGFADIYLEPDSRFGDYTKHGYIIELKYIKAEFVKTKKKTEPEIKIAVEKATEQLKQYDNFKIGKTTKIIIVASAKKLLYMDLMNDK